MKYFDSNWNELEGIPNNATLLVRAVGTYHVDIIYEALRVYAVPFCTAATRKDDVSFYVDKRYHSQIKEKIRAYSLGRQYKDASEGNHPDKHIS